MRRGHGSNTEISGAFEKDVTEEEELEECKSQERDGGMERTGR